MLTDSVDVLPRSIHVVCSGPMNLDDFLVALNHGLDSAARSGRRAVLMDVRNVHGPLTTHERFALGEMIARAQRAHDFIAAIVVVANQPLLEPERLAETVALNRGAVGNAFTNMADAERWIEDHLAKNSGGNSLASS